MRNLRIDELKQVPLEDQDIEICERKGVGHPDYICDSMMNDLSIELSREYLKRFGSIMHHNIDKAMLVAGEVRKRYGGGEVTKPMAMIIGDRATFLVNNDEVPVEEIAIRTGKNWFRRNMRFVDPDKHVRFQVELKPGSEQLTDIFRRESTVLGANDTSAAVGYAPLTETERIVYETERFVNSKEFKMEHTHSGEDVKVMGLREGRTLQVTMAMAFVDKYVPNEDSYFKLKEEVFQEVKNFLDERTTMKVSLFLNTLDQKGRGTAGTYLTVLGTSADDGDCGQVGRGNRVNGVIPLRRPAGSEAAAGKNPVSHVGKIYSLLTFKMAQRIYTEVPGLKEIYVWLLSQIGRPINDPKIASVQLVPNPGTNIREIRPEVEAIVNAELDNINKFCYELAEGLMPVC